MINGAPDGVTNGASPEAAHVGVRPGATPRGPAPIALGTAANFAVLAKYRVSTALESVVTGNVGVNVSGPTGMTGFSLTLDRSGRFSTSSQIVGRVYAADHTMPANLEMAVRNMESAYSQAVGETPHDITRLGASELGRRTLGPGLYQQGDGVLISSNVTLDGGLDDVWLFQIAGGITAAAGVKVILTGGARAKNVFWQASHAVTLGTAVRFEGIVMSRMAITLATGASVNGRLLAQTAVTLDAATVTQPPR